MQSHTRLAIHVVSVVVFSVCLAIAGMLVHYAIVAVSGNPGGEATDLVEALLKKQENVFALFGAVLTALPALTLGLANTPAGLLTGYGKTYLWILIPTLVLSAVANILIEPATQELGAEGALSLADTTALRIAAYSLTFLLAILGLKSFAPEKGK